MGYTGRILVARTNRPIAELVPLNDTQVLDDQNLGAGWWQAQLDGDLPGALDALVSATSSPALSVYILDSDCADAEGLTPAGTHWRAYLHPEVADRYGAPELEFPEDEIARQAQAWSTEAGLTANPAAVRDVLEAHETFVEETLDSLLSALGITPTTAPAADAAASN